MQKGEIIIHTDGGSRGNPGPAASAFLLEENDVLIKESSKFLGNATNNFAEYKAVIMALIWLVENKDQLKIAEKKITFILDSELVVKQINGLYKVKDEKIKNLFSEVKDLLNILNVKVTFNHVRREQNKAADLLVNKELDLNI